MRHFGPPARTTAKKPLPRGIARSGPAILSYGFRPFFLGAGIFAFAAMALWIGALSGWWTVGGSEGQIGWHAHEMLFGYAGAALGGFVLTAVPNWTGGLPVSGRPLLVLFTLWVIGRLVSFAPAFLGEVASISLDSLFLPALAIVVGREVIAGRNWQNLRVALGISVLAALNISLHVLVLRGDDQGIVLRATVALFVLLVGHIGGRIIPSFTRNYLARRGVVSMPVPMNRFDEGTLAAALIAGFAWSISPQGLLTTAMCVVAALLHAIRLGRWQGAATWREPLLLVLHVAYGFIPIGYVAVALAALDLIAPASALHVLTVGVIGMTTLAVMARASRGHTGRALTASAPTSVAFACLSIAAILRPMAEVLPNLYHPLLTLSGICWLAAFGLFVVEHAPILVKASAPPRKAASPTR